MKANRAQSTSDDVEILRRALTLGFPAAAVHADRAGVDRAAGRQVRRRHGLVASGSALGLALVALLAAVSLFGGDTASNPTGHKKVPTANTPGNPSFTKQSVRTTSFGTTLRIFDVSGQMLESPANGTPAVLQHIASNSIVAEVSTSSGAVERTPVLSPPASSNAGNYSLIGAWAVGDLGSTTDLAFVYSSDSSLSFRLISSSGASDTVAPTSGWSVLAVSNSDQGATLESVDSADVASAPQAVTFAQNYALGSPPILVRTTQDGLLMRASKVDGFLVVDVSNQNWATSLEGIPACPALSPATEFIVPQIGVGGIEGDPATIIPIQVGSSISKVEARFSDGTTDEMTPVQGIAVLGHSGVIAGQVTAYDSAGDQIASQVIPTTTAGSVPACPS